MPAIAATDVTYTVVKVRKEDSSNKVINLTIAFGDGALTYPAGGIPLTAGKMGCANNILAIHMNSPASANGFLYKYDLANNKLRIYQGDNANVAAAPLVELGAVAVIATSLSLEAVGY